MRNIFINRSRRFFKVKEILLTAFAFIFVPFILPDAQAREGLRVEPPRMYGVNINPKKPELYLKMEQVDYVVEKGNTIRAEVVAVNTQKSEILAHYYFEVFDPSGKSVWKEGPARRYINPNSERKWVPWLILDEKTIRRFPVGKYSANAVVKSADEKIVYAKSENKLFMQIKPEIPPPPDPDDIASEPTTNPELKIDIPEEIDPQEINLEFTWELPEFRERTVGPLADLPEKIGQVLIEVTYEIGEDKKSSGEHILELKLDKDRRKLVGKLNIKDIIIGRSEIDLEGKEVEFEVVAKRLTLIPDHPCFPWFKEYLKKKDLKGTKIKKIKPKKKWKLKGVSVSAKPELIKEGGKLEGFLVTIKNKGKQTISAQKLPFRLEDAIRPTPPGTLKTMEIHPVDLEGELKKDLNPEQSEEVFVKYEVKFSAGTAGEYKYTLLAPRKYKDEKWELKGKLKGKLLVKTGGIKHEEGRVRVILADITLGGPLGYYRRYPNDPNAVDAVERWMSGVRVTNANLFERKNVRGIGILITYKGTNRRIDGMDVKLTTDEPPPPDTGVLLTAPEFLRLLEDYTKYTGPNHEYGLNWTKVDGAVSYDLEEALDMKFTKSLQSFTAKGTNYTFTNTAPKVGNTYYYRVRAVDASGNKSAWSPKIKSMKIFTDVLKEIAITDMMIAPRSPVTGEEATISVYTKKVSGPDIIGVKISCYVDNTLIGSEKRSYAPPNISRFSYTFKKPGSYKVLSVVSYKGREQRKEITVTVTGTPAELATLRVWTEPGEPRYAGKEYTIFAEVQNNGGVDASVDKPFEVHHDIVKLAAPVNIPAGGKGVVSIKYTFPTEGVFYTKYPAMNTNFGDQNPDNDHKREDLKVNPPDGDWLSKANIHHQIERFSGPHSLPITITGKLWLKKDGDFLEGDIVIADKVFNNERPPYVLATLREGRPSYTSINNASVAYAGKYPTEQWVPFEVKFTKEGAYTISSPGNVNRTVGASVMAPIRDKDDWYVHIGASSHRGNNVAGAVRFRNVIVSGGERPDIGPDVVVSEIMVTDPVDFSKPAVAGKMCRIGVKLENVGTKNATAVTSYFIDDVFNDKESYPVPAGGTYTSGIAPGEPGRSPIAFPERGDYKVTVVAEVSGDLNPVDNSKTIIVHIGDVHPPVLSQLSPAKVSMVTNGEVSYTLNNFQFSVRGKNLRTGLKAQLTVDGFGDEPLEMTLGEGFEADGESDKEEYPFEWSVTGTSNVVSPEEAQIKINAWEMNWLDPIFAVPVELKGKFTLMDKDGKSVGDAAVDIEYLPYSKDLIGGEWE